MIVSRKPQVAITLVATLFPSLANILFLELTIASLTGMEIVQVCERKREAFGGRSGCHGKCAWLEGG